MLKAQRKMVFHATKDAIWNGKRTSIALQKDIFHDAKNISMKPVIKKTQR